MGIIVYSFLWVMQEIHIYIYIYIYIIIIIIIINNRITISTWSLCYHGRFDAQGLHGDHRELRGGPGGDEELRLN